MPNKGGHERRTKALNMVVTPSLHAKLTAEAARSTGGNVGGLAYMLIQLGLRHWQASDYIKPDTADTEPSTTHAVHIASITR